MAGVVVASGLHWLPIPIAAICGAVAMALTGCFGRKDVYEGVDWKIIILLGAILPLGIAVERSGLSQTLARMGMGGVDEPGPLAALMQVYLRPHFPPHLIGTTHPRVT